MSKPLKRWIKHKDGSRKAYWYARITAGGKEKWISLGPDGQVTKTVAQRKINDIERQISLGQLDMITAKIPTLSDFAEDYIKHIRDTVGNRSWGRDEGCLQNLKAFFPNRKLSEITPGDIDEYKSVRLSKVKPATVDRELSVLRHLFNLAERWKRFFGKLLLNISHIAEMAADRLETYNIERSETEQEVRSALNTIRRILDKAEDLLYVIHCIVGNDILGKEEVS